MQFCPHCGGNLSNYLAAEGDAATRMPPANRQEIKSYNQTAIWREIIAEAQTKEASPPSPTELVMNNPHPADSPSSAIVHLAFDRNVVPDGGILMNAVMTDGRMRADAGRLEAMGYAFTDEGKVLLVDDLPVGKAYGAIDYWGGQKQYKRWHLDRPVDLDPSRSGDPFFMDENMIAFGAKWKDFEKYEEAIHTLLALFITGVRGEGTIAKPVVLRTVWH